MSTTLSRGACCSPLSPITNRRPPMDAEQIRSQMVWSYSHMLYGNWLVTSTLPSKGAIYCAAFLMDFVLLVFSNVLFLAPFELSRLEWLYFSNNEDFLLFPWTFFKKLISWKSDYGPLLYWRKECHNPSFIL